LLIHILSNELHAYNAQLLRRHILSTHWKRGDTNYCQITLYTYFVSCIKRLSLIVLRKTIWQSYLQHPVHFICDVFIIEVYESKIKYKSLLNVQCKKGDLIYVIQTVACSSSVLYYCLLIVYQ